MKLIKRDYDPETGFTEEMWYEEPRIIGGPGRVTIRRLQDVEENLNENKREFNSHVGKKAKYNDSDGLHKVASIPLAKIEQWMREEGFNWYTSTDKERRAKLNDRDNRKLLVRPGKL